MTYTYKKFNKVPDPNTDELIEATGIIRLPDNACIPKDPRNRDWVAYQEWLAEGNTPIQSS